MLVLSLIEEGCDIVRGMLKLCVLLIRCISCECCFVFVCFDAVLHDFRLHEPICDGPEGWRLARIIVRIFSFGRYRLAPLAEFAILDFQIGTVLLVLLLHG